MKRLGTTEDKLQGPKAFICNEMSFHMKHIENLLTSLIDQY